MVSWAGVDTPSGAHLPEHEPGEHDGMIIAKAATTPDPITTALDYLPARATGAVVDTDDGPVRVLGAYVPFTRWLLSTLIDLLQPIRSVITVAGMVGHCASNRRICGRYRGSVSPTRRCPRSVTSPL